MINRFKLFVFSILLIVVSTIFTAINFAIWKDVVASFLFGCLLVCGIALAASTFLYGGDDDE